MVLSREFQTALYSLDGVGPAIHARCLKALEKLELGEEEFWVDSDDLWQKIGLPSKVVKSIQKFKKEYTIGSYFESLQKKDIRVILPTDEEFPPLLRHLPRHPPLLFARGSLLTGQEAFVAVVGTRDITDYGQRVIHDFLPPLVQFGKTIVSGFMYGVDVAAQRAAIETGGTTIGVLGFGFDSMYPPEQRGLFQWFLEKGATFLSPFAPHVPARPGNFPARNAVVAGMSEGVLVIEGAEDSGSLITAQYAADLGREVWAVPGSIYSRFSAGTQKLLNEGAQLVNNAEAVLGIQPRRRGQSLELKRRAWAHLPELKKQMCEALWTESLTTDALGEKVSRAPSEIAITLVELELLGLIEQAGNRWQIK